jgi:hypothetical protein
MADNTIIPAGAGGDTIRDVDRTASGIPAKTQVVQLDVGGEAVESLVTDVNPLPTQDLSNSNQDAPLSVSITGDPNGDFVGVNILEQVMTDGTGLNFQVKVVNPPKQYAQGAQMASDAPAPIILNGVTGQNLIIDTSGYQTLDVTAQALTANPVQYSNDGINWAALPGVTLSGAALVSTVAANTSYSFPCLGRWIRFTITANGSATAYLRAAPFPPSIALQAVNLTQIGSNNVVTAGSVGAMPVAGPTGPGAVPGYSPVCDVQSTYEDDSPCFECRFCHTMLIIRRGNKSVTNRSPSPALFIQYPE